VSEFEIPASVASYFSEKAVKAAVNALIFDAAGNSMPETTWAEARDYNQAVFMALQVRTELVDMMFRIWEATFGEADVSRVGEEYFDWSYNPDYVWRERELARSQYGQAGSDDRVPSEVFGVFIKDLSIGLWIESWSDESEVVEPYAVLSVDGWERDEDDNVYRAIATVSLEEFLADPSDHVVQLRAKAEPDLIESLGIPMLASF